MVRQHATIGSGRMMLAAVVAAFTHFLAWMSFAGETASVPKPNGLLWPDNKLPQLTTSRVIGSPEPPLPYTVKRAYPNLKLNFPIGIILQPNSDRLWTFTADGAKGRTVLRRFVDSPDVTETEVLLPADERMAYDAAFHPDFLQNGYVYIGHDLPVEKDGKKSEKYVRVSRFKMNPQPPYEFDTASETTIIEWPSDGHNGAAVAFGLDRMLYVTSGDGTSDSDTNERGQEMKHLTAKLLRIDVDHPAPGKMYSVPADNPFVGMPDVAPETWAFGFRNPWRMTVDRETGHIWVGNNGQDLWEQIFFVRKGDNYGWSVYEGGHPFYLNRKLGPAPYVKPMFDHHHSEARSMTGGIVHYGTELPELRGAYVYGDHSTGKIWAGKHDGTKLLWHKELADTILKITGFGNNSRGELLVADYVGGGEGAFYSIVPMPPQKETAPFPRTLSASGLFKSVKGHVVENALIPYSVNAPLWSDGAEKIRYMAIPGDAPKIDMSGNRGWKFPEATVLVKSFSLETKVGDPGTRRWIETRFLTLQQNEWVGYSYQWNAEQTEATLVDKEGLDVDFTIETELGPRQQKWHYPARTECLVCHSRAAVYTLGTSTNQMNRPSEFSYHTSSTTDESQPVGENQLAMLERLGLVKLGKRPEEYERLVNPYDATGKLESRAKSYLHANCSICHVDAGGGNAQILLEFSTPLEKMKLVDVVPIHDKFGFPESRLIAPGHPERSVLLHRISKRGRGQMPQLATMRIDKPAVELFKEWIEKMEVPPKPQDAPQ